MKEQASFQPNEFANSYISKSDKFETVAERRLEVAFPHLSGRRYYRSSQKITSL